MANLNVRGDASVENLDNVGAPVLGVSPNAAGLKILANNLNGNYLAFTNADGNQTWGYFTVDSNGTLTWSGNLTNKVDSFPSGTTLVFYQASAPTGWTKSTTHDNKALRVVSGTGGGSGGTSSFTSVFTSQTITLPQHTHTIQSGGVSGTFNAYTFNDGTSVGQPTGAFTSTFPPANNAAVSSNNNSNNRAYGNFSMNASHTHTVDNSGTANAAMNLAVQYIDVIICSKN